MLLNIGIAHSILHWTINFDARLFKETNIRRCNKWIFLEAIESSEQGRWSEGYKETLIILSY